MVGSTNSGRERRRGGTGGGLHVPLHGRGGEERLLAECDLGFRVYGVGFRVQGLGFGFCGLRIGE